MYYLTVILFLVNLVAYVHFGEDLYLVFAILFGINLWLRSIINKKIEESKK